MHNFLYERSYKGGELAITFRGLTYSASDIFELVAVIEARLQDHMQGRSYLRYIVPTDHPVFFLASLLACWKNKAVVIPERVGEDQAATAAHYEHYFPAARIEIDDASNIEVKPLKSASRCVTDYLGDIILTTTGSTGKPKGVVLDANQLILNAYLTGSKIGLNSQINWGFETDLGLTSGLCHLLMGWVMQAPLYCLQGAAKEVKRQFFKLPRVGYGGSPIQAIKLVDELEAANAPQHLMTSGDFLTQGMIAKIQKKFPNTSIHKCYGLTELGGRFCLTPPELVNQSPDSVGYPLPGFEAEIRDENNKPCPAGTPGTIYVRSPLIMRGYIKEGVFCPHLSGDWFCTNDIGCMHAEGLIYLQGRSNDSFKVGGEKVDRFTIEKALAPLLNEFEYCVLPTKHDVLGFVPVLYLATNRPTAPPNWQGVLSYLREKLPPRYIPMRGIQFNAMPRMPNGKLDRIKVLECSGVEWPW